MRLCVVLAICITAGPVQAADAPRGEETFFETKVRPVLMDRCVKCHGAQKATSGLRVDSRAALIKGGKHGPAVVPGNPEASLLLKAVLYQGERKMPPDEPLSSGVATDLQRWIAEGAFWPESSTASAGVDSGEHWAFKPIRLVVAVPEQASEGKGLTTSSTGSSTGPGDPLAGAIDAFILAELHKHGLTLLEPADKPTLLRRATFDLTGLPPTPEELDAFLADDSPAAFAKVVNRLLASPRYGQQWGRHWLDLVRYTDDFDEAWRYRDWVVNAFNTDLPYDQFVRNQVAGDLLPSIEPFGVNADGIVATTMLSLGPWSGIDRKKRLTDIVDDQIDIVWRSVISTASRACSPGEPAPSGPGGPSIPTRTKSPSRHFACRPKACRSIRARKGARSPGGAP